MQKPDFHEPLKCPICRAPWKDEDICYRCGSELSFLLKIKRKAKLQVKKARWLAKNGDEAKALNLVDASLYIFFTREAVALKIYLLTKLGYFKKAMFLLLISK